MENIKLSYFANVRNTKKVKDLFLDDYTSLIRNGGSYKAIITKARAILAEGHLDAYKALKGKLPAVTASAEMNAEGRTKAHVVELNGYIVLDIDLPTKLDEGILTQIKNDKYTKIVHYSVSGNGVCVFVRINSDKFLDSFEGLQKYYEDKFSLEIDKACKDVTRPRFMSFDPDITINSKSDLFKIYIKKAKVVKSYAPVIYNGDELGEYISRVVENGIVLGDDGYSEWVQIAHALTSVEPNATGEGYFHAISQLSTKYDQAKTQRKWAQCLGTGGVGIATLYHYGKLAGVRAKYSESFTQVIKLADAYVRQNPNELEPDLRDAKRFIGLANGDLDLDSTRLEEAINAVLKNPTVDFTKGMSNDSEIKQLEDYILTQYRPLTNKYTGTPLITINGVQNTPLDNKILNSISIDCKDKFGSKTSNSDINACLDSFSVGTYDPIENFLLKQKALDPKPSGNIKKLCDSLNTTNSVEYKEALLRRWLMGLFAYKSFEGYSPLVLVLHGKQGDGKTWWFEHLLPTELKRDFFSTKNLDGKIEDLYGEMSTKLILYNDEFGSSTVADANKFKNIVSTNTMNFRAAYARRTEQKKRISLFCGSTNNKEILADPTGNRRILPMELDGDTNQTIYNDIDKGALFLEVYNEHLKDADQAHQMTKKEKVLLDNNTEGNKILSAEYELINMYGEGVEHESGQTITEIFTHLQVISGLKLNRKAVKAALLELSFSEKHKTVNKKSMRLYNVTVRNNPIL